MEKVSTGEKIRDLRTRMNLTQQQLADMVGVSNKAISKWERGDGLPDIENLKRVSSIFNVSIDELVSSKSIIKKSTSLNIVLMFIFGLTIVLYFFPFLNINIFDNEMGVYITLTGLKILKESFISFQIGNLILGVSLMLILMNAFIHLYRIIGNTEISIQKLFSLISLIASIVILITIYVLSLDKRISVEVTFVPILMGGLQIAQYFIYLKSLDEKSDFKVTSK